MAIPAGEVLNNNFNQLDPAILAALGGLTTTNPIAGTGATAATDTTPTATTSAPSGPSAPPFITIPGQSFSPDDYNTFIQGDPGYLGLKNSLGANEDAFHQALRAAVQKSVMSSGYGIPEANQFLDAGQADQAAHNPYSTAALAGQAHTTNLRAIQNALAARGGYDSGELTYGVGNESQRFNQEDLGNRGKLADYISQLLGQESSMKGNDAAALAQELGNATSRQFGLHPGSGSQTANYDSSTGTYVDSYGNHFDQSGKLLGTAPAPSGGSPNPTPTPSVPQIDYPTPAPAPQFPSAGAPSSSSSSFFNPYFVDSSNSGTPANLTKLLNLPV